MSDVPNMPLWLIVHTEDGRPVNDRQGRALSVYAWTAGAALDSAASFWPGDMAPPWRARELAPRVPADV